MMKTEDGVDEICEAFKDTSLEGGLLDNSSLDSEQEFICSICR